jgi:hypothetical protein
MNQLLLWKSSKWPQHFVPNKSSEYFCYGMKTNWAIYLAVRNKLSNWVIEHNGSLVGGINYVQLENFQMESTAMNSKQITQDGTLFSLSNTWGVSSNNKKNQTICKVVGYWNPTGSLYNRF